LPRLRLIAVLVSALATWSLAPGAQGTHPGLARISTASIADIRAWDRRVDSMLASGELRMRTVREDTLIPGRRHERADQYYKGVRVYGADVARQIGDGQTVSIFGALYDEVVVDTAPVLSADDARRRIEQLSGATLGASRIPELVILPLPGGAESSGPRPRFALAYRGRAFSARGLRMYFVDARTGALLLDLNDLKTQTAVGRGHGVLGDSKKISVRPQGGTFQTWDELRPPDIVSLDMRGNPFRTIDILNEVAAQSTSDLGTDADNDWSDGAIVDAHVYAGWTYDYYFKRHNRQGLDNRNIRILNIVHPVRRQDIFSQPDDFIIFYLNAAYFGDGIMMYGEGLPAGFVLTATGQYVDYFSAGIDIVAHELSHGVTD
jgi:Zn-dependent metalloprotease